MGAFRWRFPQFLNSFVRWRLPSSPFRRVRRAASRLSKSIFPVSQGSQGGTRHVMKSYGRLDLRWQILRFMRKTRRNTSVVQLQTVKIWGLFARTVVLSLLHVLSRFFCFVAVPPCKKKLKNLSFLRISPEDWTVVLWGRYSTSRHSHASGKVSCVTNAKYTFARFSEDDLHAAW